MTAEQFLFVALARVLAFHAHSGQGDKNGRPYIEHVERVALAVEDGPTRAVAWLHDTVEDTAMTLDDLRHRQFPEEIIAAVDAITHRKNEPRDDYYARVKADPLALAVKMADIADNADPKRLALLDEQTRERLERKYARAREILSGGEL